jgi:hypothetical protein
MGDAFGPATGKDLPVQFLFGAKGMGTAVGEFTHALRSKASRPSPGLRSGKSSALPVSRWLRTIRAVAVKGRTGAPPPADAPHFPERIVVTQS